MERENYEDGDEQGLLEDSGIFTPVVGNTEIPVVGNCDQENIPNDD